MSTGMSGPMCLRTHVHIDNPVWWDLMLLRHLPYRMFNTSYEIAHRCVHAPVYRQKTTPRVDCVALTPKLWYIWRRTVPCHRRQGLAGAVVLLAGPGLSRDDADEGTLLLSHKLPNDSNGVATSLAFFRYVLVTTHLFTINYWEGTPRSRKHVGADRKLCRRLAWPGVSHLLLR